jgi:TonB family protein
MKRNALQLLATFPLLLAMLTLSAPARAAQQDKPEPPKIIRKSGGVLQGSATKRVEPAFPPLAKTARVVGAVVVEVTIDEAGKVIEARAISGHPLLKDATVNAARAWVFTPTLLSGTPVKVIGTLTFNFHLDMTKEIEQLKQVIAETRNDPVLYNNLGNAYALSGQSDEAFAAFRQALVLRPDYADAWIEMGNAYNAMGGSDEALGAYQQALQLDPDSRWASDVFRSIGEIYFVQQQYQEAVEAFKQAIAKEPDGYSLYMSLGMAYLKLGDKDSAREQYQILKKKNSELAEELLRWINGQQ